MAFPETPGSARSIHLVLTLALMAFLAKRKSARRGSGRRFEATIASTGQRLLVPADRSLLDVLRENGFIMASSCELGLCGSCECGYRDGMVIHRDKALSVSKRQDRLLTCVSRARVAVTLDL